MARLPRFFVPGLPLHVIQRGNDRQATFRARADRLKYLDLLRRGIARHALSVHAYVLMTNHVHLLLTPSDRESVPRLMQSIGRVYVQWFNQRYRRTGTLWEGRYKATIVEHERYLLTCMRYIELNPVRAGIVDDPSTYRWSSFRSNACGLPDDLVVPHPLYGALGATAGQRRAAYRELFRQVIAEEDLHAIRDATHHAWVLGGEPFRLGVEARGRRASRLPIGRPRR